MASRLNRVRPVGIALGYVRTGARLFKRTISIKTQRKVVLRFQPPRPAQQTVAVDNIRAQIPRDSQANQEEAERNVSSPTTSHESGIATETIPSQNEWRAHYELDLALSVTLCSTDTEKDIINNTAESADIDTSNQNERLSSERSDVSRVFISIYKSLKSTKKRIDKFVQWYRRELERRNMI